MAIARKPRIPFVYARLANEHTRAFCSPIPANSRLRGLRAQNPDANGIAMSSLPIATSSWHLGSHSNASPAAASPPSSSRPRAAVCLGAQAAAAVVPELVALAESPVALAESPVAVAVAEPLLEEPLGVPVAVALAPEAVEQLTWSGTSTPLAEQICWAKVRADCWSASLQAPTRQQATLPMKSSFAQMHLGSVPQPA